VTLAQSTSAGLLGAKASHVTKKNYSMQFILHISVGKNLKMICG
jgi:hypothetical protein